MTVVRDEAHRRSPAFLAGWMAMAGALATVAVVLVPFLGFAYRAPALHGVVETINAVVALIVGYLVYGRYKQSRRLQELLLVLALGTVATANLVLTAIPNAVDLLADTNEASRWASLGVRLLGTVLLFCAALAPHTQRVRRRTSLAITLAVVSVLVLGALAGMLWGGRLPPTVDPVQLGGDSSRPSLVAHPVVLISQAIGIVLYGGAAIAFARQAARTGDQLIRWLGAGCVLASSARVHYLLFPSLYSEYIYTGDLLRLGFYLCLLVGAAQEITSYWGARAQAAVLEDRRRLARDLHDGVIQELSYIAAQSRNLSTRPGDAVLVERISSAAGRAIDESRRALAALTRADDAPFPKVLHESLEEMASRYDVKILAAIDDATVADGPMADALLRIAGEAVGNAVRHGSATRIDVRLTAVPLSLSVTDDGCGFPGDSPAGGRVGGFGLTSMRERAEGIGATLGIDSHPGDGTTVRVSWI